MGIYDRDYIRESGDHAPVATGLVQGHSALKIILFVNIGVFLLWQILARTPAGVGFMMAHFTVSAEGVLGHGYVHTLITSAFSHHDLWHIVFNMLFFWWFGKELEDSIYGSKNFFFLYLFAGLISSTAHIGLILATGADIPALGASGSVMGILVIAALLFPNRPIPVFFGMFWVPLKFLVGFFIILDLIPVLQGVSDGVAHAAHLGGALAGFLFFRFDWRPFRRDGGPRVDLIRQWKFGKHGQKTANREATIHSIDEARARLRANAKANGPETGPPKPPSNPNVDIETALHMDEILQKISEHGIESLTPEEREFLQAASKKYGR